MAKSKVVPGIHPHFEFNHFPDEEQDIITRLSKEFFLTNSGCEFPLGYKSIYRYLLMKPTNYFQEMFNIEREIVLIFSPYETFEPRTLDAITFATNRHQDLRLERICSVLVSKDKNIESRLHNLLENDQEAKIIVPFSYDELRKSINDPFFFRNRFIKNFYSRDLFASEAPLKTDLYFFGRNDLIHNIVNRHRSNQVSGLFGLRKTGKTSVIFGIQRALERVNDVSVFIDCQNPAFHRSRWNKALQYVINEIKNQHNLSTKVRSDDQYTEEKASIIFEDAICKFSKELGDKSILLIFDEIENITCGVSPSEHWCNDFDFIYFWQTLRSAFQRLTNKFSYLIVGTNPLCVETERIHGKDNPIYGQIPLEYIPRFDVPQTREMVRRLGRTMGVQFDEIIFSMLTEDFGGHPYLIRHACSVINSMLEPKRPARVDKTLYLIAKDKFLRVYSHFIDMILNVLKDYFNDEYEMATYLAVGDEDTFLDLARTSPLYTNHLIGYGIIDEYEGRYSFRVNSIKEHLSERNKYKKLNLSVTEMLAEISERRNHMENKMRTILRMQLQSHLGAGDARNRVIDIMGEPRKSRNASLSFADLFDGNKSGILFSDFEKIIGKFWDCFKNIFGPDKDEFFTFLKTINKYRSDAHAKSLNKDEMQYIRICMNKLEDKIKNFLG